MTYSSHYLRALLAKARRPRHGEELEAMLRYLEQRDPHDRTRFRTILPWEMQRRLEAIEAEPVVAPEPSLPVAIETGQATP